MRRKPTKSFYTGIAWKRLRDWYIARHPLCELCHARPATIVDHIKELADGGASLDVCNLQSLCSSCHAVKTAAAKRYRIENLKLNK